MHSFHAQSRTREQPRLARQDLNKYLRIQMKVMWKTNQLVSVGTPHTEPLQHMFLTNK